MHIKATMRYLLTSVGMTTSKKTNAGEDVEKRKSLCRATGNVNRYSHYGNQYEDILKS